MDARDRLIESAQELLWERGYVGTSPGAVLKGSGVGQGSLYHHFTGKADLALAAIERSAAQLRALSETYFDGPGTPMERISAWLLRNREVLRGCPIGRLAHDPEIVANPDLRRPVDETMAWLHGRVTKVLTEGQRLGEFDAGIPAADVAEALIAALQGGYVLARAADSPEPFDRAIRGALVMLAALGGSLPRGDGSDDSLTCDAGNTR